MLKSLDRAIALRTTIHLFLCIGFISAVAFILSAHWLLVLAALPVCAFAWFVLYHFEKGIALWGTSELPKRATASPAVSPSTTQEPEPSATSGIAFHTPATVAPVTIAWPELLQ